MTFLKHWQLPTLAWALVMFSSPAAVAQETYHMGATTAAESAELEAYRLTIEDVHKLFAVNLAFARLAQTHPEWAVAKQDTTYASPMTVMARDIESRPQALEAVRAAGLTPRQFVVITFVLAEASLAQQAASLCGHNTECVAAQAKAVEANHITANVAFINQHQAELQRLQAELAALLPDSLKRAPQ